MFLRVVMENVSQAVLTSKGRLCSADLAVPVHEVIHKDRDQMLMFIDTAPNSLSSPMGSVDVTSVPLVFSPVVLDLQTLLRVCEFRSASPLRMFLPFGDGVLPSHLRAVEDATVQALVTSTEKCVYETAASDAQ